MGQRATDFKFFLAGPGRDFPQAVCAATGSLARAAWAAGVVLVGGALVAGPGHGTAADQACDNYATVYSVREVDRERSLPQVTAIPEGASSPGEFPGGLSGGSPVGWVAASRYQPGQGWKKTYVGAVGSPEMMEAMTEKTYEVIVKLDNGKYRLIQEDQPRGWRIGDRVRIVMGRLVPGE